MNGAELLRIVDTMHREKNIPKEVIFEGIEAALQLAAERAHGGGGHPRTTTSPKSSSPSTAMTGEIKAAKGEEPSIPEMLGRIAAQSAKQVMIQKIREAECNARLRRIRTPEGRTGPRHHSARRRRHRHRHRRPHRSDPAAHPSRFPAKRTTSARRSRPSSSKSARPASASRSC